MQSIWSSTCSLPSFEPLQQSIQTEAVVIGGGLAGIVTAYQLTQAGVQTVLLEADRIAGGQTANTTAKITAQHADCYAALIRQIGTAGAALYAKANQQAVECYHQIVTKQNIDCDFTPADAVIFSRSQQKHMMAEAAAAKRLGLSATYTEKTELPISGLCGVRLHNQARFHPLQFIKGLLPALTIYEQTPALTVQDHIVKTPKATVNAKYIIFACHYPFVNIPGWYFTRMYQQRSYVLALENAPQLQHMYLSVDPDGLSFRSYNQYLLLGGAGHRTGDNRKAGQYQQLVQAAQTLFPGCRIAAKWSAQDCMPADGIPYIGRFSKSRPYWYVATGFQKWGMTTSMVAARIITGYITGSVLPEAKIFSPHRISSKALVGIAKQTGHSIKGLAKQLSPFPPAMKNATMPPHHGGIVNQNGQKAAATKIDDNPKQSVHSRCTHLGCRVEWNPEEQSWDCPCHGSRFNADGTLLSGPAQKDLKPFDK